MTAKERFRICFSRKMSTQLCSTLVYTAPSTGHLRQLLPYPAILLILPQWSSFNPDIIRMPYAESAEDDVDEGDEEDEDDDDVIDDVGRLLVPLFVDVQAADD